MRHTAAAADSGANLEKGRRVPGATLLDCPLYGDMVRNWAKKHEILKYE